MLFRSNLLKSPFQTGVCDGLTTFGVQGVSMTLWNCGRGPFQGPMEGFERPGRLIRDHPIPWATNDIPATIDNAIQLFHVTITLVTPALGR